MEEPFAFESMEWQDFFLRRPIGAEYTGYYIKTVYDDWLNGGRLDLILDAILLKTGTTLDTLIKDIPTVAEFEARSLLVADYVVVGDTIAGVTAVTNDVGITQAGADKVWVTAARALTDKAGFALSAASRLAIWHELLANIVTADTIGKLLKDNVNAPIGSIPTTPTLQATWTDTKAGYLDEAISAAKTLTAAERTAIWDKNVSAYSGAGYAGTYLKTLYDDWLNGGRLDLILDAIKTETDTHPTREEIEASTVLALKAQLITQGTNDFNATAKASIRTEIDAEFTERGATLARYEYLNNINNANLATVPDISTLSVAKIGYLENINNAQLLNISADILGRIDESISAAKTLTPATINSIRNSVCLTGDTANSIGKILYELYINRITSARAARLDANISSRATAVALTTVDTIVDAIKAKTDNLPTDPADESLLEAAITTAHTATDADIATVDGKVDTINTNTDAKVAGKQQIAKTTEDLNQVAGTYDLFTGTTQDVLLESLLIRMPNIIAGGAITSISIQTNDATSQVLISAADGAVANLTAEAQLAWQNFNAPVLVKVGKKVQLTIAGGAHGSAYVCDVVAKVRAVTSGGYLA